MKKFLVMMMTCVWLVGYAQEDVWTGKSADFSRGKLMVSENGRYLQYKDGTPFFYLGDTAWELFHRLDESEVEKYLENRRAKGFTVIQAVLLPELDGLRVPNRNGDLPLKDIYSVEPNEAYFKWVDQVIRMAEAKGLYVALLPAWGDKVDKQGGIGPEVLNPQTADWYGTWLGRRYKNFKNIIWVNGGDCWGGDSNYPTWDALGKALRKADKNHLITYHPEGEQSSANWFHNSSWLDFNMIQTGHCQRTYQIYEEILLKDYSRALVKPVLDGEPRYENQPVCWLPDSLGWFDEVDVRQSMYWSLFSGAMGYTYGCHDVWQMAAPGREPVGGARGTWESSLDLPGAFDLIHARRLMERFEWSSRVPAQEMIISPNGLYERTVVALRGEGFAFVYFPMGDPTILDFSVVSRKGSFSLSWMNPRTGEITVAERVEQPSQLQITPPSSGRGNDWVLIIENI